MEAATPLLAEPLGGSVFLTANPAPGGLPKLTIQPDDPIPLRLDGTPELSPQGIRHDVHGPARRPAVPLPARPRRPVPARRRPLHPRRRLTVTAAFTAQSGATAADRRAMTVLGRTAAPAVKARIARLKSGRPRLKVKVVAAEGAPGADARRREPAAGARGRAQAGAWPRRAGTAKLARSGDLRLTLPGGTRAVTAKLRKGAPQG